MNYSSYPYILFKTHLIPSTSTSSKWSLSFSFTQEQNQILPTLFTADHTILISIKISLFRGWNIRTYKKMGAPFSIYFSHLTQKRLKHIILLSLSSSALSSLSTVPACCGKIDGRYRIVVVVALILHGRTSSSETSCRPFVVCTMRTLQEVEVTCNVAGQASTLTGRQTRLYHKAAI